MCQKGVEMKKVYRKDAVYKRTESGRYIELGYDFEGFPADGIWLVQDGRSSMSCLIGAKERVPMFALNYRIYADELCSYINKRFKGKPRSRMDEATAACDFFAEKAEEKA
jgi:hypothetical protein